MVRVILGGVGAVDQSQDVLSLELQDARHEEVEQREVCEVDSKRPQFAIQLAKESGARRPPR